MPESRVVSLPPTKASTLLAWSAFGVGASILVGAILLVSFPKVMDWQPWSDREAAMKAVSCHDMADDIYKNPERHTGYIGKWVSVSGEAIPESILFDPAASRYSVQVECGKLVFFLSVPSSKYPNIRTGDRVVINDRVVVRSFAGSDGRLQVFTSDR